jgi:hypothetical protein
MDLPELIYVKEYSDISEEISEECSSEFRRIFLE